MQKFKFFGLALILTGVLSAWILPAQAFIQNAPRISSVLGCPADNVCVSGSVKAGETLNINGANFLYNNDPSKTKVSLGDTVLPLQSGVSAGFLSARVPASVALGSKQVIVTVNSIDSNAVSVTVAGGADEVCDPFTGENCEEDCDPALGEDCDEDPFPPGDPPRNPNGPGGAIGAGLKNISGNFDTSGKLTGSQSLGELLSNAINIILGVVFIIAVLFLIIGGYQYITSAGNEKQAGTAKKTLLYAIIGIVVIMLSYTIVFVLNETLSA